MNKKKNLKKILFVLSALFLMILVVSLIVLAILRNQLKTYAPDGSKQLKDYQSYILRLENPTIESASELIKSAILKEARACNCMPKGYPKAEITAISNRIIFDDSTCGFVDIPGTTSSTTPWLEIYLLPKSIFSKVKSETQRMYLTFGNPGTFCSTLDPESKYIINQQIILSALWSIGVRGYEEYD